MNRDDDGWMRAAAGGRRRMRGIAVRPAALAALLAAATVLGAGGARAQNLCTAQGQVDVHYCNDDTDLNPAYGPTCNPLTMADGDTVTLTIEFTNGAEFNGPGGDPDPPAAELQVGQEIQVHYACSGSACAPGQVLPNWFTFDSVVWTAPGVSYSDDGNGSTGKITIVAPGVVFPRGDGAARKLVRLSLTAHQPPGTGTVFARAEGTATILLITDTVPLGGYYCIAGLTGTGEGSVAGLFASITDELAACQHPNKQLITIDWRTTLLEYSNSRVGFVEPGFDPATATIAFGYESSGGPVYVYPSITGFQKKTKSCWRYLVSAKNFTPPGIKSARLCEIEPDKWCLDVKGYADFNASLPTDRVMWLTVDTGAAVYAGPKSPPYLQDGTWLTLPSGFVPPQNAHGWYLPQSAWE